MPGLDQQARPILMSLLDQLCVPLHRLNRRRLDNRKRAATSKDVPRGEQGVREGRQKQHKKRRERSFRSISLTRDAAVDLLLSPSALLSLSDQNESPPTCVSALIDEEINDEQ